MLFERRVCSKWPNEPLLSYLCNLYHQNEMVDWATRSIRAHSYYYNIYIKIIMWWAPNMGCDLIAGVSTVHLTNVELFGCIEIKIDAFVSHIAYVECDFNARDLHRIDHLFKSHQKIRCTRNWGLVSSTPTAIHMMNHWVAFVERISFKLIFQPFRLERKHRHTHKVHTMEGASLQIANALAFN